MPTLKPLVAAADATATPVPRARPSEAGALFVKLAESIDAALDAEMLDVARSVGAFRQEVTAAPHPSSRQRTGAGRAPEDLFERTPMAPMTALAAAAALGNTAESTALTHPSPFDAEDELGDDKPQKTVEVPRDVFAKMIAERIAAARDGGAEGGTPAPVESGKIVDSDVAALLGRIYLQRLTGRLVLRRDAVEKVIFFERGAPILGMSSDSDDRLGEMLVRQGRLTSAQLAQASAAVPRAERRLGVVLAELGFIKPTELSVVVRRHFEEIIHSAFAWESGEWSLGPGQPNQEIVLLDEHPAAIILAGVRRKYGAARLSRCLGGGEQVFRRSTAASAIDVLARMAMTSEERAIVDLFDGTRTLDEVRAARRRARGGRRRGSPGRCPCWGSSIGSSAASPRHRARGRGRERQGPRSHDDRSAPVAAERAEMRARILARHALVEEGDYFEMLDLPRGAALEDVARPRGAHARARADLARRRRSSPSWAPSCAPSAPSSTRRCACSGSRACARVTRPPARGGGARGGARLMPGSPRRAVFFGSPAFAVPFLEAVARVTELVAVVSQPDRPAGRGKQLTEPAVKVAARRLGVPVIQPERIRAPDVEADAAGARRRRLRRRRLRAHPAAGAPRRAAPRVLERSRVAAPEAAGRGAHPVGHHPRRARHGRGGHAHGGGAGHGTGGGHAQGAHRR